MNKFIKLTNNSDMENLFFLIPLFFIILLVIPLLVNFRLVLDAKELTGIVVVYLWKIKIRIIKIYVKDNKIFMYSKKKKEVKFSLSSKSMIFMEQFLTNLKDKIQPKKLYVYSKIGVNDAKDTAMLNGSILILIKTAFCYLKNKKPMCKMNYRMYPSFKNNYLIICANFSFLISILDIIFSLFSSIFSLRGYYGKQSKLY